MQAGWHRHSSTLWQQGKRREAVRVLSGAIRDLALSRPLGLFLQHAYYCFLENNYQDAVEGLKLGLEKFPDHPELMLNLGVCQRRACQNKDAIDTLERYTKIRPTDPVGFDGLCAAYSHTQNYQGAQKAGEQSLFLKDQSTSPFRVKPQPMNLGCNTAKVGKINVIAFSLFGEKPRYLRGAIDNMLSAHKYFPTWIVRFYMDNSVPRNIIDYLKNVGAQIIVEQPNQGLRQRLSWRFKVANDGGVDRFLVRDVDSVVSQREALAVQEWQKSDKSFHVMRDWWTHTDLILAGMWGGRAGILPDVWELLKDYTPPHLETPNVDQWFLRDRVWPLIKSDVMIHDRFFRVLNSLPWPGPAPVGNRHVGQDVFTAYRAEQVVRIRQSVNDQNLLRLLLKDEE